MQRSTVGAQRLRFRCGARGWSPLFNRGAAATAPQWWKLPAATVARRVMCISASCLPHLASIEVTGDDCDARSSKPMDGPPARVRSVTSPCVLTTQVGGIGTRRGGLFGCSVGWRAGPTEHLQAGPTDHITRTAGLQAAPDVRLQRTAAGVQ